MSTSPYLPDGDPRAGSCGSCGAPMASDQRYCLSCGARRQHARLPFQDALVPAGPVGPAAGPPSGAVPPALWAGPQSSGPATATLLAALACVLIAFGVGVLVGDDGGSGSQQPIVLGGAPAAAAATPATTTADTSASSGTATDADTKASADPKSTAVTKIDKSKLDATQKKEATEIEKTSTKTPKAVPVPKSTEKELNSKNPDEARDASRSLPDAVVVGGN